MNPIDNVFQKLAEMKRKAFIPFISAGDPDLDTTGRLIEECASRGASIVEVGFPYSDPIADGSVIQASYTRALATGLRIDDIFAMLRKLTSSDSFRKRGVPLVGMVSYSLVFHRGPAKFISEAQEAGLAGAIVPDLPVEEAVELARIAGENDFKLIQLVTPTTPPERALRIAQLSTGFLYCVSVVGITGERVRIPPILLDQLRWLRSQTKLPLCVGFGVSTPDQVKMLRDAADGIIVGSAIVRQLERFGADSAETVICEIGEQVATLVKALE